MLTVSSLPEKFVTVLLVVGKLVMTFDPDLVQCTLVTYHMKKILITFETLQVLALNGMYMYLVCGELSIYSEF